MIILDLNIFIIFGMILIHLHALGHILFWVKFLRSIHDIQFLLAILYLKAIFSPLILKASTYMTADHGESFQLQTFFMIRLRIFCHVRPDTFDGIVDVINDDLRLSCCVTDEAKGQSTSI